MDNDFAAGRRHETLSGALRGAARAILDEKGPQEVSLCAVAARVGVSATAAYRHFVSQDYLMAAVAADGFRELAAELLEAGAGSTDPLTEVAFTYLVFLTEKRSLFGLMFGSLLSDRDWYPDLDGAVTAALRALERSLAGVEDDPVTNSPAAKVAWGLVHGLSSNLASAIADPCDRAGAYRTAGVRGTDISRIASE